MNKRYPTLEELNDMSLSEVGNLAMEMEKDGVSLVDYYYYSDDLLQEDEVIFIKKT
jgi:hypothetical protein